MPITLRIGSPATSTGHGLATLASRRRAMAVVALLALSLTVAVRPASASGLEICAPESAGQAYDAVVAAAPDGSQLEVEAVRIARDALARGTFDTDGTASRLDELARSAGYSWDCEQNAYVLDEEDSSSEEDEAAELDPPVAPPASPSAATTDAAPAGSAARAQDPARPTGEATAAPGAIPSPSDRSTTAPGRAASGVTSTPVSGAESATPTPASAPSMGPTPIGAPFDRLSVSAEVEEDRQPDGRWRWLVGGGLMGALATVVYRRR